jgi:probable dihydroxyacetone kinase regulator
MFKVDQTKRMFAEAIMELMHRKPLDKITVSDIISFCGASRRTFYYHFKDKQDLICWIFDWKVRTEVGVSDAIDEYGNRTYFINELLHHMYDNRGFYANALRSGAQNNLVSHLFNFIYNYRRQQISVVLDGRYMDPKGIKFLAEFFTHGIIGTISYWANDSLSYPPEQFDNGYRDVSTRCLHFLVEEYLKNPSETPV